MKKILTVIMPIVLACATNPYFSYAQGMAVNTSAAAADGSAMLDVSSTSQGVLVPRMNATQRGNISSPATGLLVYHTDVTPGFYYNSGTPGAPNWVSLNAVSTNGLKLIRVNSTSG